ncbi:hypothetical protein OAK75_03080 [Bacteriovoracales bacterium]|nr:hypothetical protein [Bacteriovoracales bacterium]
MTLFLFLPILLMSFNLGSAELYFKGQKRSLTRWEGINQKKWLDFYSWKKEREIKDRFGSWENLKRERELKERVGHVVDCRGRCLLFRGLGKNKIQFKSTLKEGDEIQTFKDSYLWFFLLDGTMVRLSPLSSITLKEINLTEKEVFIHARVNFGNLLWLSRDDVGFSEIKQRETDTLFRPIPLYDALPRAKKKKVDEKDLFSFFEKDDPTLEQYKKLNQFIDKDRAFYESKKKLAFLVMPNATLFGERLKAEIVVLLGGETYIKRRDHKQLGLKQKGPLETIMSEVFLRGYENKSGNLIEEGQWYKIDPQGKSFENLGLESSKKFALGELMTKNIPTLLLTREYFLRRYSWFVFNPEIKAKELAEKYGHRLWKKWGEKKEGLRARVEFLKEYTRRVETTNLKESVKLRSRLLKRGETVHPMVYDNRFYKLAMQSYYKFLDYQSGSGSDKEDLNSTRHPFWGKVNAYGK